MTIDTLRADFVSYSGRCENTTPYLDSLAADGVVFQHAYAPSSLTAPSMASLFTGVYPTTHGIDVGLIARGENADIQGSVVPGDLVTLAESFQQAGYVTVGVPSNKNLTEQLGFGQGFDFYIEDAPFMEAAEVNDCVRELLRAAFGEAWREEWKDHQTFLWIHYFDPHIPYLAHEPWIRGYAPDFTEDPDRYPAGLAAPKLRELVADGDPELAEKLTPLYSSEIRYVDDQFQLLARELGLAEPDVAMIVTSDHGEEFLEHGALNHGKTLYEEVVRVPLFARWPEGFPTTRVADDRVCLLDVYPTLLDLCGVEPPPGLQGASLAPLLRGTGESPARPLCFEQTLMKSRRPIAGLIAGEWKLIRTRGAEEELQLFNLREDPMEIANLTATDPEQAQKLTSLLQRILEQLPESAESSAMGKEDSTLQQELRDLGYTGK